MINNSLQGDLQEAIRNALNCANSYEGDLYALCNLYGVADGAVSGRLIPVAQKHSPTIGTASGALNYLLQNPTVLPSLGLNFVDGTDRLDSRVTFTRASNAWRFNSSGVLTQATTNTPRFDYDPSTLAPRGLLIEEQRTNSIRNNTMVGAVAGTPGTLPTNWTIFPTAGLSSTIVGTGTEAGINYIDIRLNGTASASGLSTIYFEAPTNVAAANGQTWTNSAYVRRVAGSNSGFSPVIGIDEVTSGGGFLTGSSTSFTPTTGDLSGQRVSHTRVFNNASTAFARTYVFANITSGSAINITLRIGLPQLEQGAFATSPILTSGAAATRAAGVAVMTGANFSSWYNQNAGTFFVQGVIPFVGGSGFPSFACADDTTTNNAIELSMWDAASDAAKFGVWTGGVNQASITAGTYTAASTFKLAGSYAANDFAASYNGAASVTDTSGTVPTVTRLLIGANRSGGNPLNGWVQRLAFYGRVLSDSEKRAITS